MKSSLCLVIQNRLLDGWEEGKLNPTKRDGPKNSGLQSSFRNGWPNNGVTPSSATSSLPSSSSPTQRVAILHATPVETTFTNVQHYDAAFILLTSLFQNEKSNNFPVAFQLVSIVPFGCHHGHKSPLEVILCHN